MSVVCAVMTLAAAQAQPVREVAITFDDLPVAGVVQRDVPVSRELTAKLLASIAAHRVLHTGRDLETRRRFEAFLAQRGYQVAPVTIDNDEYIFAAAYDRASFGGGRDLKQRVAAAYVPYMDAKFAFFERNAVELFGREIRLILLVHANALNADEFGRLAQAIERRGYRFITLERALEDPAYRSPDTYVGPAGITWLHRWALTKGMPKAFFQGEPAVPQFVLDNARP